MLRVLWVLCRLQLENSAQQLEGFRKLAAEAQDKFMKERAVRRRLHEQLQQLRGNIRVMCRCAPRAASLLGPTLWAHEVGRHGHQQRLGLSLRFRAAQLDVRRAGRREDGVVVHRHCSHGLVC